MRQSICRRIRDCEWVASANVTVAKPIKPSREYHPSSAMSEMANRVTRCVLGLALFGSGIACMLNARLGASPWEMFHQGVSRRSGISVGLVIEITGFVILLAWIPLRQRPGIGTILNALEIGLVVDAVGHLLPTTDGLCSSSDPALLRDLHRRRWLGTLHRRGPGSGAS